MLVNFLFYLLIFFMGTLFGSFLTLASYRIPLNQDITHKRSYCPNCNHRLEFLDLIPLWSYIFLGGKCRYCKKKISSRYFIIELLAGISFIILALSLRFTIYNINVINLIEFSLGVLYIVFLFLIGAIDKEHNTIDTRVLIYGIVISLLNVIYQYNYAKATLANYNINRVILYLVAIIILNLINMKVTNKNKQYVINVLILLAIMSLFTQEITTILTIVFTLIEIAFTFIINKIINKGKKANGKMHVALYLVASNAILLIYAIYNFYVLI